MTLIIIWDAFLDYLLSSLSPYDATNCEDKMCYKNWEGSSLLSFCPNMLLKIVLDAFLAYLLSFLSTYDATHCMRRSSRQASEFVVFIWWHKFYLILLYTTCWVCCHHLMPQIVFSYQGCPWVLSVRNLAIEPPPEAKIVQSNPPWGRKNAIMSSA